MSVKLDESGSRQTFPFSSDAFKPDWLGMLRDFPNRLLIGSDQFLDERTERLTLARKFIDSLPPEVARIIANENARRIYRLDSKSR